MNRLKIITQIILLGFFIVGCKSTKRVNCDAYSEVNMESYDTTITLTLPYIDSFVIEPLHIHYEYDYLCLWLPADTLVYHDTLTFKIKTYKKYVR